ncbi:hypothetical protein WA026_022488 [Henosepilachna vigintioctopunctata]|uniref:Lipocalin/cytosolic fatty-acid binding domain-containing protein n=1 Tax=Henosepilachna vigintioctopunctata TaxID=420089 RepID=A0AAW1TRJ6_9CUCU
MLEETSIMFYLAALLTVLILEVRTELPVRDDCPCVSVQQNFDVKKFMGVWFLQAQYPEIWGAKSRCYKDELTLKDNNTIELVTSKIHEKSGKEHKETVTLTPAGETNEKEAKFEVNIPTIKMDPPFPFWIVSTDYNSYAIVWSCRELKLKRNKMSMRRLWLVTRDKKPADDILEKMHKIVLAQGLDDSHLELTDNTDCNIKP